MGSGRSGGSGCMAGMGMGRRARLRPESMRMWGIIIPRDGGTVEGGTLEEKNIGRRRKREKENERRRR